jgi:predicted amidohydrolase YtcJ
MSKQTAVVLPRVLIVSVVVLAMVQGIGTSKRAQTPASFVLQNGIIYTADDTRTMASAVAIQGNKIVAIGEEADVEPFITEATRVIDLNGKLLVPGLIDAHNHAVAGGINAAKCSLNDVLLTVQQMKPIIDACLKENPISSDKWFEVVSLNPSGFQATAKEFDLLVSDRPAVFRGSDGHVIWVNTKGLIRAKITAKTKDPVGGKIERDAQGNPTGKLIDSAAGFVNTIIPRESAAEMAVALKKVFKQFNNVGITAIRDPAINDLNQAVYEKLVADGSRTVRVAGSVGLLDMSLTPEQLVKSTGAFVKKYPGRADWLKLDQVKVFSDGVIEAPTWTAAMLEPYLDKGGKVSKNRGELYLKPELFKRQALALQKAGFSIHVHAVGDRAVRTALDAFEYARKNGGPAGLPNQIVHLQVIDPYDFKRFAANRVIAGFQATWAIRESYTVEALEPFIGSNRYKFVYPLKSIVEAGAVVAGGSDWPVTTFNPFVAIQRAVTRKDTSNAKPLGADQAITVEQALDMYTRGAGASLPFMGLGQIKVGNKADLVVLSQNILEVDPNTIEKTVSELTMVDGKVIFEQ